MSMHNPDDLPEDDGYDDPPRGEVTCKFCGEEGLMWDQHHHDTTGRWRLIEADYPPAKPHSCRPQGNDIPPLE